MKQQNRYDVVIIGAGFSGLGAGIQAQRYGLSSLILEAESSPGGLCRNTTVGGCDFDLGPKIVLIDDPIEGADLLSYFRNSYDRLPMLEQVYIKEYGFTGFPVQRHLHDLPDTLREDVMKEIDSLSRGTQPRNYEEWLRGLYGDALSESILIPYEEKKWQMSLREMDYHWALDRPVKVNYNELIEGARRHLEPNRFYYYPAEGNISTLSQELANDAGPIKFESKVIDIDLKEKYVVAKGERYYFCNLVSTMPFDEELEILHKNGFGSVNEFARTDNSWLGIKVLNMVFEGELDTDMTAIYFPDKDIIFRRVTLVGNLCPALKRKGITPVSVEISMSSSLLHTSDTFLVATSLGDLKSVPGFENLGKLIDYESISINNAYPLQRNGIHEHVKGLQKKLEEYGLYHCGRNATFNYCNSDKAFMQGKEAVVEISLKNYRKNSLNQTLSAFEACGATVNI